MVRHWSLARTFLWNVPIGLWKVLQGCQEQSHHHSPTNKPKVFCHKRNESDGISLDVRLNTRKVNFE